MIFKEREQGQSWHTKNAACDPALRIKRVKKTMPDGIEKTDGVESTLGSFIFNEIILQDLGFR